ncbi:MAG: T9SS type A sorting domain-containing protein [Bacteroidales bacterium]|jgi:hypothetical protein
MKKLILILTMVIVAAINATAQIPNSGFENWRTVGNCIEPTGWYSLYYMADSAGTYDPVTQSTDHFPALMGMYSAKISNDTALWNTGIAPGYMLGWGILTTGKTGDRPLFPVTGHPVALSGYFKFLPENEDTMGIFLHIYKSGVEVATASFQTFDTITNWTYFKAITPDSAYSSADSARITINASNEPKNGHGGPRGNSVLYVDNLSLVNSVITSVPEHNAKNISFSVYPNPASNNIVINAGGNTDAVLNTYDETGKLIRTVTLKQDVQKINIEDLSSGTYMMEMKSKEGTADQKLIIQR